MKNFDFDKLWKEVDEGWSEELSFSEMFSDELMEEIYQGDVEVETSANIGMTLNVSAIKNSDDEYEIGVHIKATEDEDEIEFDSNAKSKDFEAATQQILQDLENQYNRAVNDDGCAYGEDLDCIDLLEQSCMLEEEVDKLKEQVAKQEETIRKHTVNEFNYNRRIDTLLDQLNAEKKKVLVLTEKYQDLLDSLL